MAEEFAFPALEGTSLVVVAGDSPQTRAAEIVNLARDEARRIEQEAAAAGRKAGYAAGLEQAAAELGPARETLVDAARRLDEERDAFIAVAERRAVELALMLSEKIVGATLRANPELVYSIVNGALKRLVERDRVVVVVSPDDVELVRNQTAAIAAQLGSTERFEVVADRRVPRGGCVLRTSAGEIDARVSEQLARAAEILVDPLPAEVGGDA
jgi:flagellar assembly protein FliH